jgi:periplasmic divalent cation tolerance protein
MVTAYITAPPEDAESIARTLVDERLAACVNRFACDSVYRWQGVIHEDEEVLLLAKTTDERYEQLRQRVVDLHPYDVPCIERFDESDVFGPFETWRDDAVGSSVD